MLFGCLAQLARASALHAEGQGFESLNTHHTSPRLHVAIHEFRRTDTWDKNI